eukprot:TRINITY_DN23461_c0_g1_i1.p1 TRINITY_DN23461_c0_g1~~TRINITY_DN23461_c0_g1_i1.p1  ORF type:complete len:869 (-),score=123.52 TRINITY_DN23461_c0_g1_i1:271-2877(-)
MWPKLVDHTREQCLGVLRNLECSAYSSVVDAFRAGGDLTEEKKASLLELARILNIPVERHKTEIRRAVNDELLNTVSYRLSGPEQSFQWMKDGRRIIPILPRLAPLTGLTPIAKNAAGSLALRNNTLLPPSQTASLPPPPRLPKPPHLLPPTAPEFVKPEPVQQNGTFSSPDIKTEILDDEMENENGFVVLPSGMAVRLRDGTPPPGKRGKRKRSVSKSIEIFPGGLAQLQAGMKLRDGKSPPRKISSVLGAGHGYARPLPSNSTQTAPVSVSNQTTPPSQQKSANKVIVMPDPAPSPAKRGPGRPPGPSSPQVTPGSVYQTTRGRPRLINPGMSTRPRVSRPRGPRPGVVITPRLTTPSPILPASGPVLISQTSAVQVTIPQPFHPPPPPRLALRPTALTVASPRSTTIQLKQESAHSNPALQGLKVISHSTTKIVPKSATAVYVVPSGSRPSLPQQRIVAVNSSGQRVVTSVSGLTQTQRIINPNLPGVIRTVRARQPIAGKPSVIVVQKGAPQGSGVRTSNPATVALYRPARAVVCGPRMGSVIPSGMMTGPRPGDSMNTVRLPRPVTPRQATPGQHNSNVIVLDLSQDQPNSALANILSASGLLSDGSNNTNSSIIVSSSSGISTQFSGSSTPLSGYNMTSAALNTTVQCSTAVTGLTRTLPTMQRRIFVQRPAASGSSAEQLWLQGMQGANNTNHINSGQAAQHGVVSIAPAPGSSSTQTGVPSMNSNNHTSYTDIFSAALEQANISLDSQNFIVDSNSSSTHLSNIAPHTTNAALSQIFHLATTTGGRIVTLPHRPTFAKGVQNLSQKLPLHALHAPPGEVMPMPDQNENSQDDTEMIEDFSPFLCENNGQNNSGENEQDQL